MEEFKRRRSFKKIVYSPVAIVFLAVILFFLVRALWGVYGSEQRSSQELSVAQRNAADLENRAQYLTTQIDELNSPRGLEGALREKYPVAKEGEQMVIIVPPSATSSATSTASAPSWWQRFLDFFGW